MSNERGTVHLHPDDAGKASFRDKNVVFDWEAERLSDNKPSDSKKGESRSSVDVDAMLKAMSGDEKGKSFSPEDFPLPKKDDKKEKK
jgi:hypothetical protein